MTEQRLAGLDLAEMYLMAHGGQPAAAASSQNALTQVSDAMERVSRTLGAPLRGLGAGWQGDAAQAAQVGIGQHARWAELAAQQASATAADVGGYLASARTVTPQVPSPAEVLAEAMANPASAELVIAEATQRAQELFEGHAVVCQQATPGPVGAPAPTAGTRPVAGLAAGEPAPEGQGRQGRSIGTPRVDGQVGAAGALADGQVPLGRTSAAGLVDEPGGPGGGGGPGERAPEPVALHSPGEGVGYVPANLGYVPGDPTPRHTQVSGHLPGNQGGDLSGGASSWTRGGSTGHDWFDGAIPPGGVLGAGPAQRYAHPGSPPPTPRTQIGPGTDQDDPDTSIDLLRQSGQSGQPGQPGPFGAGQGGATGMMPPMLAGGMRHHERHHQTPGYLLDEDDVFNGDDWAAPPVIGP